MCKNAVDAERKAKHCTHTRARTCMSLCCGMYTLATCGAHGVQAQSLCACPPDRTRRLHAIVGEAAHQSASLLAFAAAARGAAGHQALSYEQLARGVVDDGKAAGTQVGAAEPARHDDADALHIRHLQTSSHSRTPCGGDKSLSSQILSQPFMSIALMHRPTHVHRDKGHQGGPYQHRDLPQKADDHKLATHGKRRRRACSRCSSRPPAAASPSSS
jgi:hypothetical protein